MPEHLIPVTGVHHGGAALDGRQRATAVRQETSVFSGTEAVPVADRPGEERRVTAGGGAV